MFNTRTYFQSQILDHLNLPICEKIIFKSSPQACNFIKKETLAQVFSCEFCEISKNTVSYKTPPVAASEYF